VAGQVFACCPGGLHKLAAYSLLMNTRPNITRRLYSRTRTTNVQDGRQLLRNSLHQPDHGERPSVKLPGVELPNVDFQFGSGPES